MVNDDRINADRFLGFADLYDSARPKCPEKVKEIILAYLGRTPSVVVDLGCGTGLSTIIWSDLSDQVIGIEPSTDMLRVATEKASHLPNVSFLAGFSDQTGLADNSCDVITCSQSFHWMNPETTLREVSRILRTGGIFAAYDCDWPPVCKWEAELAYDNLFKKVSEIESRRPENQRNYLKFDKEKHLSNMKNSGIFQYQRERLFSRTRRPAMRIDSLILR